MKLSDAIAMGQHLTFRSRLMTAQKITIRKRLGAWFVAIPADVPDFSKHRHFTDALAKVQLEELRRRLMKPATQIVHWPGQDTPACEDHLQKLVGLGAVLGFRVTWTPCEETVCSNCESEEKKFSQATGASCT